MIVIPSREDCYERILEAVKQFAEETEKVEAVSYTHLDVYKRQEIYRGLEYGKLFITALDEK